MRDSRQVWRSFSWLAALLVAVVASSAFAQDRVLLINIAEYRNPSHELPGLERNVDMMLDVFDRLAFERSAIRILRNGEATKANVISAMNDWLLGAGPTNRAVFYYSGHGTAVESNRTPGGCNSAFVTHEGGLLHDYEFQEIMARSQAREVLVIVDSCYSGSVNWIRPQAVRGQPPAPRAIEPVPMWLDPVTLGGYRSCDAASNVINSVAMTRSYLPRGVSRALLFTAAAANELALMRSDVGSFFTKGLHEAVMRTPVGQSLSFEELRSQSAVTVRNLTDNGKFLPHTPQLFGERDWFFADFFEFGRLLGRYWDAVVPQPDSAHAFLDSLLANSQFRVGVGANKPSHAIGDELTLTVTTSKAGYLNVIDLGPDGTFTILFPNGFNSDNRVPADYSLDIPGAKFGNFLLEATEPIGASRVFALVTTAPLNLFTYAAGRTDPSGTFKFFALQDLHGAVNGGSSGDLRGFRAIANASNLQEQGIGEVRLTVFRP
jgi:metacaspase-1